MSRRRPTLKDVARLAGVSLSTASRALAEHPDVSETAKAKVQAMAQELGYRPSMLARGLVGGNTSTLGLLVSHITNPFYPQLAGAIEEFAHSRGYTVFLCNTLDDPGRTEEYLGRLLGQGVDGLIHASIGADESLLEPFMERSTPVVLVNRRSVGRLEVDMVVADNDGGTRQAVRHLLDLGHQDIAFIGGPEFASVSRERLAAFRDELQAAGLALAESLFRRAQFTRQSGYQMGRSLLEGRPRPTAIFAVNDVVAMGVLDAALKLGLRVPLELSLVGFDDIEPAGLGPLRLTTVASPIQQMGQLACERLLHAIAAGVHHQPQYMVLQTHLVVRDTTARAPTD